ncbi:hypothetical protein ACFL2V_04685 [Pseudomonadota bacterium]
MILSLRNTLKLKFNTRNALVCAAAVMLTACNRYSAESTEGWVIDAETKKPIEGVIVVANWQLHKSTMGGKTPAEHLNIMETTTKGDGFFYFEGWEAKTAQWGFFIDLDPELLFYKEGYEHLSLKNPKYAEIDTSKVRQSAWDGKTIELKKFNGVLKEYASHLSLLNTSVHTIFYGDKCEWKRTPKLVMAVAKQKERFKEREISNDLTSLDDISGYFCGSATEYLESIDVLSSTVSTNAPHPTIEKLRG